MSSLECQFVWQIPSIPGGSVREKAASCTLNNADQVVVLRFFSDRRLLRLELTSLLRLGAGDFLCSTRQISQTSTTGNVSPDGVFYDCFIYV
jgi:hypothetical protein